MASSSAKAALLRNYDLAMFSTAGSYDVEDKADRGRSVRDLSSLFFQVAGALGVDLFVEAGAKDAESSRRARRLLELRRIVAFEANPYTFEVFNAAYDNAALGVEFHHLALSDQVGTATFNVMPDDDGAPRVDGQGSILRREGAANEIEVTVAATTVDTFFADFDFDRGALWVDVEGALAQVLTGARRTLEKSVVLVTEVEDRAYWDEQWLRPEVVSYLYDRGLVPLARDYQSRYQYNIVFVREALFDIDRVRWMLALHHSRAAAGRRHDAGGEPPRMRHG